MADGASPTPDNRTLRGGKTDLTSILMSLYVRFRESIVYKKAEGLLRSICRQFVVTHKPLGGVQISFGIRLGLRPDNARGKTFRLSIDMS